jgi:hypothetical protein
MRRVSRKLIWNVPVAQYAVFSVWTGYRTRLPSLIWFVRRYLLVALLVGETLEKSCAPGTRSWPGSRVSVGATAKVDQMAERSDETEKRRANESVRPL